MTKKPIEQYRHKEKKRVKYLPVGSVTPETDQEQPKKNYQYDPHKDLQLQWAGKTEQLSFDVDTIQEEYVKLAKNLKAEIDEELIDAYRETISLPFEPGQYKRIAVKIVDDRNVQSLKVMGISRFI